MKRVTHNSFSYVAEDCSHQDTKCIGKGTYICILTFTSFVDLVITAWLVIESQNLTNETNNLKVLEELRVLSVSILTLSAICFLLYTLSVIYWSCFEKTMYDNSVCYYGLKLVFLSSSYIMAYVILGLAIGTSSMVTVHETTNPWVPSSLSVAHPGTIMQPGKISNLQDISRRILILASISSGLKTTTLVMGHLIPILYRNNKHSDDFLLNRL